MMENEKLTMVDDNFRRLIEDSIARGQYTDELLYDTLDILTEYVPPFLKLDSSVRGFILDAVARESQQLMSLYPTLRNMKEGTEFRTAVVSGFLRYCGYFYPTPDWEALARQVVGEAELPHLAATAHLFPRLGTLKDLGYVVH